MLAALKIFANVLSYRLRRLEMANLFAATTIMVVLRLAWDEIGVRFAFALMLNVLVYLNNDYCDVQRDLRSTSRDRDKTRFLFEHMRAAMAVQLVIVAALATVALLWDPGLLAALVAGGGVCWAYSAALKRRPYVDVLAMMAWGTAMLLVAFPLDHAVGWCLALQLGLVSGVFESIQVIRDHDEDAQTDVRSTAVVLGIPRTLVVARLLIVASSAYMVLVLHSLIGFVGFVALLYPLREGAVERYWHWIRITFGIAWLAACIWVYVTGRTAGLLVEASADARLPFLAP